MTEARPDERPWFWEIDIYSDNADRSELAIEGRPMGLGYHPGRNIEFRRVVVNPQDIPDNAHWKGWVW